MTNISSPANETRTKLDLEYETPGPNEARLLQDHHQQVEGLQSTIAQLELTARRAIQEKDAMMANLQTNLQPNTHPAQASDSTAVTIAALSAQVRSLAEMVQDMRAHMTTGAATSTTTRKKGPVVNKKYKTSQASDTHSSEGSSDEDYYDRDESGPASVTIFARAIKYKYSDPDRISERKDVDGVDSDYKRIADKRPHLIKDATDSKDTRGSELSTIARALYDRLADSLDPAPSIHCVVGIATFALHAQADTSLQRKIQNTLMAARNCKTSRELNDLAETCKRTKRIPSTLLEGSGVITDSPFIVAIKQEVRDDESTIISAFWKLLLRVISLDRCPSSTLAKLNKQWTSITSDDVEDALQEENDIFLRAQRLLKQHHGKPFCTFDGRVKNMIKIREKVHPSIREKFYSKLELDNKTLIDLSWDQVWDRIMDADAAAARSQQRNRKERRRKQRRKAESSSSSNSDSEPDPSPEAARTDLHCVLHGACGHDTNNCGAIRSLNMDAATILKLKKKGICCYNYYGTCRNDKCSMKHMSKTEADSEIAGVQVPRSMLHPSPVELTMNFAHLPIPEEEPELPGGIHNTLSSFDEKLDLEYDCDDLIQNPMLMVPKQYGCFMDIGMYDSLYND